MVLERLNLHARQGFHVVLRLLIVEARNFILHESGEFHAEAGVARSNGFDHALEVVLIKLREFGEAVVSEQVCQLLGVARVVLIIHRHLLRAHEQRGLGAAVATHDQAAAFAYRD